MPIFGAIIVVMLRDSTILNLFILLLISYALMINVQQNMYHFVIEKKLTSFGLRE